MFDENSNATAAATLVGPNVTNTASLHTANLNNSTHLFNQLLNAKDSRWLQLEVCREFQRGQCSRSDVDCKFAHPPSHVDVQNGRVTACYDSIKGRCTRENPKCKYLHPPQHLKDQLLINGRNNLAIKNLISSQLIQPTAIPNNLQMAQLMQQQTQPMQTLPYHQYYSTPLTAIYPLLPAANPADFQTLSSPVAQQLALLQSQQQLQQKQVAAISPLNNQANLAIQYQQQMTQALLQQHLAATSQQSQMYASGGASPALTSQTLTQQALNQQALTQQFQLQQHLASQQQQAALFAALTQQAQNQANQAQVQAPSNPESRKRNARVAGFEENGEEKKSTSSSTGSNSHLAIATTTASTSQQSNVAEIAAFQQQLLLLNAVNANAANASAANASSNGMPNGKRLDKNGLPTNGHAIPIYAQQPGQFGPYIGYAPVSYSGQLPPRF